MDSPDGKARPDSSGTSSQAGAKEAPEATGSDDRRVAPSGKYRVLGFDMFAWPPEPPYLIGDYDSKEEAMRIAREKREAAVGRSWGTGEDGGASIADRYRVYDDTGQRVGGAPPPD